MPHSETDFAAIVDTARALQLSLDGSNLHISSSRSRFDDRISSEDVNPNLPISMAEKSSLVDPASVTADVAAQLYLEQKAKDQYIKTIVSDDAPNITAADNEQLRRTNEEKKQVLKIEKQRLAEAHSNIQTLSPMIEQDLQKARKLTNEATSLAQQILDARLQLKRLRQTHPHPRLTIQSANAQLDNQVEEMQQLDEKLQQRNEMIEKVKAAVKDGARDVERLRLERGEVEKQAKATKNEAADGRVVGLYDWYTASLGLHKIMHSLESFKSPSENELCLTYNISQPGERPYRVVVSLLFVPNTQRLAEARVDGLQTDVGDVVEAHVQSNDVPGLLASLLAQGRAEARAFE